MRKQTIKGTHGKTTLRLVFGPTETDCVVNAVDRLDLSASTDWINDPSILKAYDEVKKQLGDYHDGRHAVAVTAALLAVASLSSIYNLPAFESKIFPWPAEKQDDNAPAPEPEKQFKNILIDRGMAYGALNEEFMMQYRFHVGQFYTGPQSKIVRELQSGFRALEFTIASDLADDWEKNQPVASYRDQGLAQLIRAKIFDFFKEGAFDLDDERFNQTMLKVAARNGTLAPFEIKIQDKNLAALMGGFWRMRFAEDYEMREKLEALKKRMKPAKPKDTKLLSGPE